MPPSPFLSVALGRLFSTALNGRSKERPELTDTSLPVSAKLPVVAARGGTDEVRRLFDPPEAAFQFDGCSRSSI
jgi:RNA repair, ligase-Pnkp-associating, region of Hen1